MKDLLLNKGTLAQAEAFIAKPSHALLISGGVGGGKFRVAQMIAAKLLGIGRTDSLVKYPYFTYIKRAEGKQDISIDSVRSLNKLLKLKVPGTAEIKRVVIIEDAQDLNEEASNALLKMLEEPAADCVFILTATSAHSLLPTISSRAQQLQLRPVGLKQSLEFLKNKYPEAMVERAWRLSQGAVGLMLAILRDDKQHPLKLAVDGAKDYLRKSSYERLLLTHSLSRDKKQLALLLEALSKLLGALQQSVIRRENDSQTQKVLGSRKLVLKLQAAMDANVSPKFIVLELSLNLL